VVHAAIGLDRWQPDEVNDLNFEHILRHSYFYDPIKRSWSSNDLSITISGQFGKFHDVRFRINGVDFFSVGDNWQTLRQPEIRTIPR